MQLQSWHLLSEKQQTQVRGINISSEQIEYAGAGGKQLDSLEKEALLNFKWVERHAG
jgi:hypothetical protein